MGFLDRLLGRKRKAPARVTETAATPAPAHAAPPEPALPTERRRHQRVNARKGTRALIIDDSPTVVAALRKVLRSAGYETREALDAEHGLVLMAQEPPELVFLDIILPGMNGFNALRQIRKTPQTQDIPVIVISGNEHATEQFYANRIGADDFMKKPFSRHEIFARIETLLDHERIPRRRKEATPALSAQAPLVAASSASVPPLP